MPSPSARPDLPPWPAHVLPRRHARDDPRLGEPLCPDCYDYTGSVLFNACAPELWRRFTITLRRALARQAARRLHDLRHIHATTLLLSGVPVHVVAARLGHADPAITLRVYAHVIRTAEAAAADIFAQAVNDR